MPYTYTNKKGQQYYLHGKDVTLQGGRQQRIHYFARQPKPGETLDAMPAGSSIVENQRTGLPFLKGNASKASTVSASTAARSKAGAKA